MKRRTCIHDSQRLNPNDFVDPLTFHLLPLALAPSCNCHSLPELQAWLKNIFLVKRGFKVTEVTHFIQGGYQAAAWGAMGVKVVPEMLALVVVPFICTCQHAGRGFDMTGLLLGSKTLDFPL